MRRARRRCVESLPLRTALLLCVAPLLTLPACCSRAGAPDAPRRAAVALPRVAAAAPAPPAPPALVRSAAIEDRAILHVQPGEGGAAALFEIGAEPRFVRSQSPGSTFLRPTPDGWMAVLHDDGASSVIHRYVGSRRTELTFPPAHRSRGLDVGLRDGAVLSVHREGRRVARLGAQAGAFSAASPHVLRDLTATADGVVWAIVDDALLRRTDDRWEPFAALAGSTWERFVANADEPVLLVTPGRVLRYAGGAWREVPLGPDAARGFGDVAVGPDGTVVFAKQLSLRVVTVSPDGSRTALDLNDHGIPPGDIRDVARDGRGRTWLATTSGLVVLGADGDLLRWYAPGATPERVDLTDSLIVTGRGPAELPPAPPVHGRVRGRVLADGQPVAGARVELCEQPLVELGTGYTSPCDPLGREETTRPTNAITRADGRFELVDVPTADVALWFAVQPPDHRWVNPASPSVDANEVGETPRDVGDVTVRLRPRR